MLCSKIAIFIWESAPGDAQVAISQSIAEKKRVWRGLMSTVEIWIGTEQVEEKADK